MVMSPAPRAAVSWFALCAALFFCSGATPAVAAEPPFAFASVSTLDEMAALIRARFPVGSSNADLRRAFVEEGHATLKTRPGSPGTEKYIYDIDLCHYYIWRWNISADYDAAGALRQAYVNGTVVYADGPAKTVPKVALPGQKTSLYRVQRLRPEAYKGEHSLGYLLFDRDSDTRTTDDQVLMGAGPSRADPVNMGKMFAYIEADPWRSIFDSDPADRIVPWEGSCAEADALYEAQKQRH